MKGADAAPGAVCRTVLQAEHERRPVEAFHHAARDDAHHAAVPALAGEHQRRVPVGDWLLDALLENDTCNLRLGLLAIRVEVVEQLGKLAGPGTVFGEEHFDHISGAGHAAGRVDSRRDSEGDLARGRRVPFAKSRDIKKRAQTQIADPAKPIEPALYDRSEEHTSELQSRFGIPY